ncbi:hypothetical protein A0H81_14870 [Grifola frondosa]|uniref:Uncharacterized protein n=1 Tax=Grifola frondosa TaxID=5627 RepID=A0A1C7LQT6_GRIFR|nr:hypothetical protein A0H81_14870 [Grifola frondosa]
MLRSQSLEAHSNDLDRNTRSVWRHTSHPNTLNQALRPSFDVLNSLCNNDIRQAATTYVGIDAVINMETLFGRLENTVMTIHCGEGGTV